ncbi:MAG: type II toxin-antitoxin system RelE/ParE family toxin [Nannocystaceae bacterium]
MKRSVLLRPEARAELVEAWAWYEARRAGLGDSMVTCVEAAVSMAARIPESFQVVHGEVRRALVRRFPYGVYFVVDGDALVVLAIAHARREPGYWADRIGKP